MSELLSDIGDFLWTVVSLLCIWIGLSLLWTPNATISGIGVIWLTAMVGVGVLLLYLVWVEGKYQLFDDV